MQGGTGRFWLNSATGSQLAGSKFFLDTGASATNGQDFIIGDWNAGGTRTLTLSGLQGFGTIRTDSGTEGVRNLIVDQSGGDTTFNGMLLSHRSGAGVNRAIAFEKKGSSNLTMAGIVGVQTAGAAGTAPLTVTVTDGTLTFTAANTYTGGTTVNGGTLLVNNTTGSGTGTGTVTVTTGTLGGTGTIAGSVVVAATGNIAPGTSAGTLAVGGNLDLSAMAAGAGKLKFELDSLAGTNDRINVTGTVALGTLALDDLETTNLGGLQAGTYTLITSSGLTGTVDTGVALITPGFNGQLQTSGNDVQLVVSAVGGATYASWIDGFFPGETDDNIIGAGADPDKDGIPNSVEMVIGGDPKDGMDAALLPTLELVTDPVSTPAIPAGDYLLFTYRRTAISETAGVTAGCETDTDLVGPWTPAIDGVGGVLIQEDLNFSFTPAAPADTDRVRVYVPLGANTELFGRLNVQVP
jgi:autotransporter-associated beta strand protein